MSRFTTETVDVTASMKVPPKRKGNAEAMFRIGAVGGTPQ